MEKTKKVLMSVLVLAFTAVLLFFAVACGETNDGPVDGGKEPTTVNVVSLEILEDGAEDIYFIGDSVNANRIVVRAELDNGKKETFVAGNKEGCTVEPTTFAAGDDKVTVTYGGKSTSFDINLIESALSEVEISLGVIPTTYASGATIDLSGISVTAKYGTEYSRAVDDWTLVDKTSDPEKVYDDPSALELADGDYEFVVRYGGVDSESFDISVFNGYVVEAENIQDKYYLNNGAIAENPDYVAPEGESYMERINPTGTNEGTLEDGVAPGSVRKAEEPASGGAYLGEVKNGAVFAFHIWSDVDRKAEVILRASSGQIEQCVPGATWTPTRMADMQFNQVFSVNFTPAGGTETSIDIDDSVVLPGGELEDVDGVNSLLWVNWQDVTFGEVDLKQGDNVFTFTVISELQHASSPNGPGGSCAANIDRLEVKFID